LIEFNPASILRREASARRAEFETDMMGTVRVVQAAVPFLKASKAIAIVIIASVSGCWVDFASWPCGSRCATP
jgi:3-oxoacyl-[acyl-carrier protein] reductase